MQFCDKIKGKEQIFLMQDMPKHIQVRKMLLIFFYFVTLRALQIFVSDHKNRLTVATAMSCAFFISIHQKFDSRRMDENYEF